MMTNYAMGVLWNSHHLCVFFYYLCYFFFNLLRYLDCPLGTDEVGCFGCNRHSYSCFNNFDEYQKFKSSSGVLCYTLSQKCDGITDCITGKDEEECSMLIKQVGLHTVNIAEKSFYQTYLLFIVYFPNNRFFFHRKLKLFWKLMEFCFDTFFME